MSLHEDLLVRLELANSDIMTTKGKNGYAPCNREEMKMHIALEVQIKYNCTQLHQSNLLATLRQHLQKCHIKVKRKWQP